MQAKFTKMSALLHLGQAELDQMMTQVLMFKQKIRANCSSILVELECGFVLCIGVLLINTIVVWGFLPVVYCESVTRLVRVI